MSLDQTILDLDNLQVRLHNIYQLRHPSFWEGETQNNHYKKSLRDDFLTSFIDYYSSRAEFINSLIEQSSELFNKQSHILHFLKNEWTCLFQVVDDLGDKMIEDCLSSSSMVYRHIVLQSYSTTAQGMLEDLIQKHCLALESKDADVEVLLTNLNLQ